MFNKANSSNQCVTVPKMLNDKILFPAPNNFDTGSENFSGTKFFWYHQKKWKIPGTGTYMVHIINLLNSWVLVTKLSSGTKYFRYRFQDFSGTNFFLILVPIPPKNYKFPVPLRHILDPTGPYHTKEANFWAQRQSTTTVTLDCDCSIPASKWKQLMQLKKTHVLQHNTKLTDANQKKSLHCKSQNICKCPSKAPYKRRFRAACLYVCP